MNSRNILALFSAMILLTNNLMSTALGDEKLPDEQFIISASAPGKGFIGYSTANSFELRSAASIHVQYTLDDEFRNTNPPDLPNKIKTFHECRNASSKCIPRKGFSNEALRNYYMAVLTSCKNDTSRNCVLGLSAKTSDGVVHEGKLLPEEFSGDGLQNYIGDSNIDLPDGNSSFIVDIPKVPHPGGTKYLVVAQLNSEMWEGASKFAPAKMQVGIFAVSIKKGNYPERTFTPTELPDALHPYGISWKPSPYGKINGYQEKCVQHNLQACAVPYKLPLDVEFKITLRIDVPVQGWFHGRVTETELQIKKSNDGGKIYEISAKPVIVPMIGGWKNYEELTSEMKQYYSTQPQPLGGTGDVEKAYFATLVDKTWSLRREQTNFDANGMEEFLLWVKNLNDRALASPSLWMIRSIDSGGNACYSNVDSITGIVQTNASNYLSGPPDFNISEASLDYKVAGPHYLPDGTLNQGTYDLVLKTSVAQCLYGFSQAPAKATVSIITGDGKEVAETVSLNTTGEWIKLRAAGFTYSSPTLRVKLISPDSSPSTSSAASTTTITQPGYQPQTSSAKIAQKKKIFTSCKKGNKTIRIAGKIEKCPKGYKLVR